MTKILALLLPILVMSGCDRTSTRQRKPVEIETVDVDAGYDANLDTGDDERARPTEIDIGGVLPSDFPPEMPLFSPSSIVDFGPGFVEVDTPVSVGEVRSSLGARIQRSGWAVVSIGESANSYSRDGWQVQILLTEIGSGTRIRYEY